MSSASGEKFDFIVVGAGASGCTIAWRLAHSKKRPRVLLVEAGGRNDSKQWRTDGDRWISRMNPAQAWGYQTVPQKHLDGLVLAYDRGKGLGGSTSINFGAWNIGSRDDYDEIAELVGDDDWKWNNVHERYKRLESYYGFAPHDVPEQYKKYLDPKPNDHGHDGPLKIGFPPVWEKSLIDMVEICNVAGYPSNPDINAGNPMGVSICPNTAYKGLRIMAADLLVEAPSNLRIITDVQVSKVVFDGDTAIGISTLDGRILYATNEVILSAGSLDTPKILMLSGVGPGPELAKFNIPLVKDVPYLGRNMRDHHFIFLAWERADHTTERKNFYRSKELQATARAQWEKDQTGPLAEFACCLGLGFLKNDVVLRSEEFKALPEQIKTHLQKPTIPTFEIAFNVGIADYFIDPDNAPALTAIAVFVMNTESKGTVTLQSADPSIPCLYDPNFFSHPYDQRVAIEATKEVLTLARHPAFLEDNVGDWNAPKSDNEEDILDFWKKYSASSWHMTGTCKMGKEGEVDVCVDKTFRIAGLKNLRVADMSVVPILPNNHTQTTAYCTGLIAGDKLVAEYGLDE